MPRSLSKNQNKVSVPAPHFHLYRQVVLSFVILTSLLVLVVLYFSFVSAKITITPKPQRVIAEFNLKMAESDGALAPDELNGVFFSKTVEGEKEFSATGSEVIASDVVGRVKIINNYRRPQPLVATTRLLTADNILLRTKTRVEVSVGGSVEVEVYADDPKQLAGRVLAAGTRLTIINLWPVQLQENIYAESLGEIKTGENTVTVVTADDLVKAKQVLADQLIEQSFVDLGADGKVGRVATITPEKTMASATVGETADKFQVKIKAIISGVLFDKASLISLAENRLRSNLSADQELATVDYENLTYTVDNLDLVKKTADLKVHLEGNAVLQLNSEVLSRDLLKGLSKKEAQDYLISQPGIAAVKIDFFPFWIRKIPRLVDHIEVVMAQ
ncbi:MAG: hypothetical protein WCT37_01575 [Patescibacteria group bacterium]|jgi:hypothetical protein